jgi:hypothetical protein
VCGDQALRLAVFLSTGVLFIPVVVSLSRVYSCPNGMARWLSTSLQCYSDMHLILVVTVSAMLAVFVGGACVGKRREEVPWVCTFRIQNP